MKKFCNHHIDKRKDIMKNTSFKVEDASGNVIKKGNFSQEQMTKPCKFLAKII